MKKIMALLVAGAFIFTLSACETTKGVGKDIQNAGQKMEQVFN
ncbi:MULTISPECIES: entericidin A/B family lipoprotein [Basfia]|nr:MULTISPECIES: entericidin A/B family lipoprotein [Basfia]QIM68997.1 entericidin EcnAB [Basfia succiniciproducens]SCY22626.1 entericidin B [Basfia succiniciproducens]